MDNLPEKALSIRQPWAWAILHAGKRIENRPRRFNYRGPICLHASLYMPKQTDCDDLNSVFCKIDDDHPMIATETWAKGEHRGGIIGTAEIVDCVEHSDSPWFFGPYGLVLENVQPVELIPVKGALGLFNWKRNLTAAQSN